VLARLKTRGQMMARKYRVSGRFKMRLVVDHEQSGQPMNTVMRLLVAVVWLGGIPAAGAEPLRFNLAGVEVTLPDDGWEVRKIEPAPQRINYDTGGFDSRRIDRRLLVRRSDAGKTLSVLLITGSLGEPASVRFHDTSCPKVPAELFYSRRLALREDDPPQCVLIGGPFGGPDALRSTLEDAHLTPAESDLQAPDSVWQVVAFATNMRGARFTVEGVVSADGFAGLPETQPRAEPPARVPPAVAAWADAVGAAVQKALGGFGSHKTTLPKMAFTAAAAPR
jgi:hypothetical protein